MGAFQKSVKLWNGGIILYKENKSHPFWKTIKKAIDEINSRTIIKFVTMNDENPDFWIYFTSKPIGNYASVGQKFQSEVNIDKNVRALHELAHVIGMIHEHQREDRDEYITIHEDLLEKSTFAETQIIQKLLMEDITTYDIYSCQHYWDTAGKRADVAKALKTITYNRNVLKSIKTSEKLSDKDIECINSKYEKHLISKNIFEFFKRYPSEYVSKIYLINRISNSFWKKNISRPRKSRTNQLQRLKEAIHNIEEKKIVYVVNIINVLTQIIKEIKLEKNLSASTLRKMCEEMLSFSLSHS